MIFKTFKINKSSENFNSFMVLIIAYLMIIWDSINFYINSFYSFEKIGIIFFNIVMIGLLLLYYKIYKNMKVDTYTYKYKYDEYLVEILKSVTLLFYNWKKQ